MKFPGQRKSKHYFPIQQRELTATPKTKSYPAFSDFKTHIFVTGIDQTLVDIVANIDEHFLERHGLIKGQSALIDDERAQLIYQELKDGGLISDEFAGGTVANTIHNFAVLSDANAAQLGVMSQQIHVGDYAYRYLCDTSSKVNLDFMQPVPGTIGRCFTFITPNGERSFGISGGAINKLSKEFVPAEIISQSSALVLSSYLVRCSDDDPMLESAFHAIEIAKENGVPVVLTLGTKYLIEDNPSWWQRFIRDNVTVLAMNEEEGLALTGYSDPLMASDKALEWVDMVLCTAGPEGLYMAGYSDEQSLRETGSPLASGAIEQYNRYEYSRPMLMKSCTKPVRIFSHIAPYLGGPDKIMNTNGAGDGALSAILHDMAALDFYSLCMPQGTKQGGGFLSYSSLSQICKYANRVSYEVLTQHSPRLSRALPDREDSLEEAYWAR